MSRRKSSEGQRGARNTDLSGAGRIDGRSLDEELGVAAQRSEIRDRVTPVKV